MRSSEIRKVPGDSSAANDIEESINIVCSFKVDSSKHSKNCISDTSVREDSIVN